MLYILIVCSGNTCRSPMAETLLRHKIVQAGLAGLVAVASAGTGAWNGSPASLQAIKVMKARELDLLAHRSRLLAPVMAKQAGLILTMTPLHKQAVQTICPQAADKTYTLHEYAVGDRNGQVIDPYGGDEQIYSVCAQEIEKLLDNCWSKIVKLAGKYGEMANEKQD